MSFYGVQTILHPERNLVCGPVCLVYIHPQTQEFYELFINFCGQVYPLTKAIIRHNNHKCGL